MPSVEFSVAMITSLHATSAVLPAKVRPFTIDTSGTKGAISIGSIIYTAGPAFAPLAEGEIGFDSFTVTVRNKAGQTAQGTFVIEIVGINDEPTAVADALTVDAGESVSGNLLANDSDIDNGDTFALTSTALGPSNGTLDVAPDGSFIYTPAEDFSGTDGFAYEITDAGGLTSRATVSIEVLERAT